MLLYTEKDLKKELAVVDSWFADRIKQLRVGRARPDQFETILVSAYGADTEMKNVANIVIESATSVIISPWDKSIVNDIVKAISESDLGLSSVPDSDKVRINLPPMTEESRKETVKELNGILEEAKVLVRQVRKDFNDQVEDQEGVSEDDQKMSKQAIQKAVDAMNKELESLASIKEEEIMSI